MDVFDPLVIPFNSAVSSQEPTGGEASNGLGLSLVKSLVDKLKGEITLHSEVGKGSTFEVVMPELS